MKHLYLQGPAAARCGLLGWFLAVASLFVPAGPSQAQPRVTARSADFSLFDNAVAVLPNGNLVVADPGYSPDTTRRGMGAVYLYDGRTKALISVLTGSTADDQVGSGGITVLANGNFVVRSPDWNNGAAARAGAVTWGSGTRGVSGVVSAANSLVGATTDDQVGNSTPVNQFADDYHYNYDDVVLNKEVTALPNGHYVVSSPYWHNGAAANAGAVTWGNGNTGIRGVVSAANSLVGTHPNDQVGNNSPDNNTSDYVDNTSVRVLTNGHYVVSSPNWRNRAAPQAGAVTWGNGATGVRGAVSAANSLVGSHPGDQVGLGVTELPNGNYVVSSPQWKNRAAATAVGAVTWSSGQTGATGVVSAANSLVGAHSFDYVGNGGVTVLPTGHYVVSSRFWHNGAAANAGAVTWGNGRTGVKGVVGAANSLVGSHAGDDVGANFQSYYDHDYEEPPTDGRGITVLRNGHYVVSSPEWQHGAGAVTWASGATGARGVVSATNSLVGAHRDDQVGTGVVALANGHYVVRSPRWQNRAVSHAGAVTWGHGQRGVKGAISAANSLVGVHANDRVGLGVTALANGHYVVSSPLWQHRAAARAGAVTWGNGWTGVKGAVNAANSLVGAHADDQIGNDASVDGYIEDRVRNGQVTALPNGHYVVSSPYWRNGAARMSGAATWGSGTAGVRGVVSAANSLVGSAGGDLVSSAGVTALPGGRYVVCSPHWANGVAAGAGAVTLGNGTAGATGGVSAANSLVGTTGNDLVGSGGVTVLATGHFVVHSPSWKHGSARPAGAVTWGSGTAGVHGAVSPANSLVDFQRDEYTAGSEVLALPNGNYLVSTPSWPNGAVARAGAVTWGSGQTGTQGAVSAANSLVGTHLNDQVGVGGVTVLATGHYVVSSPFWKDSSAAGAVTWGSGTAGVQGRVSAVNSLVGTNGSGEEGVEEGQVAALMNGDYLVLTHGTPNGPTGPGVVLTPGRGTAGVTGGVSAANSYVSPPGTASPR
ncbi:hypothetical protein ACFST9_00255 [Hymenobacter monticola]|uniref:Uncharacterized protein n=1 Tax=Hymenobacter monticola TaxID=1705399 RepID=A0ABY4BFP1_9BACT|nr:hypothetical protein [Hymenobacter monticola]UOE36806.1 hypothetical protein MTP16_25350 [Hymenobacter monticola]